MNTKKIFILLLIISLPHLLFADIKFETGLNKQDIFLDELIEYSIKAEGDNPPDFQINAIPDFSIINQRRSMSGGSHFQMIINNKVVQSTTSSQSKTLHITLRPEKAGELQIGPFTIAFNNKNYIIEPLKVNVRNERKYKNIPEKLDKLSDNAVFLIATLSENKCYVNQPVYVDFSLFYRTRVRLSGAPQLPQFTGFQAEKIFEIEDEQNIKGKQFKVLTLRQLLYPLRKGTLEIPSAVLNLEVNYDPFWGRGNPVSLKSDPLKLEVIEPENNFIGLVSDDLKIKHKLSTKKIMEFEAFILTVELTGRFNLKSAVKLDLKLPDSIELYNSSDSVVINSDHSGLYGSRYFNYILIPRKEGEYTISTIPLKYFSARQKKFNYLNQEIKISVEKSDKTSSSTQPIMILSGGSPTVIFDKTDITYIIEKMNGASQFNIKKLKKYNLVNIIPLIAFFISLIISIFIRKLRGDTVYAKRFKASRKAQKKLKQARAFETAGKNKEAYSELYNVITQFIADKFNVGGYGLSSADINTIFSEKNVEVELTEELIAMLKKFDFKRFSPIILDKNETLEDIEKTLNILSKLERLKLK